MTGIAGNKAVLGLCLLGGVAGAVIGHTLPAAKAADTSLSERLQRAEDELAIMTIQSRYGYYLDDRDLKAYADLFAEDGEWVGGLGKATGPTGIQKMLEDANMAPNVSREDGHASVHVMTNPLIRVAGNEASALSKYTVLETGEDGKPRLRRIGHYRDRMVRGGDGWKFVERITYGDIPANEPTEGQRGAGK